MLVIVSDLHLTDGTLGDTVSLGAFSIFARRLQESAVAASWRTDGAYRPVENIDLVLLGDVFDLIRTTRWTDVPDVRPWGNLHAPRFLEQVDRITGDILWHNQKSLAILRQLASEDGLSIPAGRPGTTTERQSVPVRIHYMVGNHDWLYHLAGHPYDALREQIIRHLGLAGSASSPFAHDITENEELLHVMRRHRVTARHGDLFDPFNYEGDRDTSSLGDAIVIELVSRFVARVQAEMFDELPAATLLGLREIDNIRPLLLIPVWIDGLLDRTCSFPAMRKRVKAIWDQMSEEFLAVDFVRQRDGWSPFDLVDGLERALKFSRRLSVGWASSIAGWLNKIRGASGDSYYVHALAEQDFRNRRAKHIVYGHTHAAESVPLDASYAEGYVLNQMYFNSGTWRRVHRQTQLAPAQHEFIAHDEMNYLAFYQGDERGGRPYETWTGSLGYLPTGATIHRIDPGRGTKTHASGQPISAPDLHQRAPHFATPSARPLRTPTRRI